MLLCFFFHYCFALKASQDSLLQLLSKTPADTQKVQLYFQLYDETAFNSPNQASEYVQEALQLSESLNYQRGIILSYDKFGGVAMQNSDFDRALFFYQRADSLLQYMDWPREQAVIYGNYAAIYKDLSMYDSCLFWLDKFVGIAESISNEGFLAYGLNLKGDIYRHRGQNELAARNFLKALRIYEMKGDKNRLADSFRFLGEVQTTAGHYSDAEKNLKKACVLYEETNDSYYWSQALRDLGYMYRLKENYTEAKEYNRQALEISFQLDDPFGIAQARDNLAELAFLSGQYQEALQQYRQAFETYQKIEDLYSASQVRIGMAEVFIRTGQYQEALAELQPAEQFYEEIEAPIAQRVVYNTYHKLYQETSQPELALSYYKKFDVIQDSIDSVAKNREMEELQIIYEVEKKDQEIVLLAKDVEVGRLRRRLLTIGLLASVLLGGLFIYMQIMKRRKERKIEEERRLRQAAELEKNRLEKEQLERELASQVLQLCRKNELLTSLKEEIAGLTKQSRATDKSGLQRLERTIQSDIRSDTDWQQFLATFEKVHPNFLNQVRRQGVKLSPAEQRLACLLKMNLLSKEIATLLNITDEGVKKARYRLRKKLGLSSQINLQEFLINLQGQVASA